MMCFSNIATKYLLMANFNSEMEKIIYTFTLKAYHLTFLETLG